MKRFFIICLCMLLCGCGGQKEYTDTIYAMDTVMELSAYGPGAEAALTAAKSDIFRLDALFDRKGPNSEIAALNETGSAYLSTDTAELLSRGLEISELTNGAFDMSVAPVVDLWGFYDQEYRVPEAAEITHALEEHVNYRNIHIDAATAILTNGAQLDPGGIAKGYTSARVMEIFKENGVTSGLVSLGGNVQVRGSRPDGDPWRVAIQSPDGEDYAGILSLTDCAAITSGDYQRYFEQDGKIYHHIIDPATGYPADSDLTSVTIVCTDATLADGLSTALYVMGKEKALDFWRENGGFDVVLITRNSQMYVTKGLEGKFESNGEFTVVE